MRAMSEFSTQEEIHNCLQNFILLRSYFLLRLARTRRGTHRIDLAMLSHVIAPIWV